MNVNQTKTTRVLQYFAFLRLIAKFLYIVLRYRTCTIQTRNFSIGAQRSGETRTRGELVAFPSVHDVSRRSCANSLIVAARPLSELNLFCASFLPVLDT